MSHHRIQFLEREVLLETICFVVVFLGVLYSITTEILIPDSYEIVHVSECLMMIDDKICSHLSWNFRPIVPSLLLHPLLYIIDGLMAFRLLCLLSICFMFFSIYHLLLKSTYTKINNKYINKNFSIIFQYF